MKLKASSNLEDRLAQYIRIIECLPQLVYVSDIQTGEAFYLNRVFLNYFGPIDTSREARLACVHPDDRSAARTLNEGNVDTNREVECRLRRKDGRYLWHKLVCQRISSGGQPDFLLGTALDIDDIVRNRQHIEKVTSLLHLAQDAAAAAVLEWDLITNKISVSGYATKYFGLATKKRVEGDRQLFEISDIAERICPEDIPRMQAARLEAMQTGDDYTVEYRAKDPLGQSEWRWYQFFGRLIYIPDGKDPARIVGLTMDITERKAVENALQISEKRLALALDSSTDGMWDWDLLNDEIWISDHWLLKIGENKLVERKGSLFWRQVVYPDDYDLLAIAFHQSIQHSNTALECEHRILMGDATELWVSTRGRAVEWDSDGRATRMVGTQVNISRRKAAELLTQHMALHDALTSLPNRVLFREKLKQAAGQAGDQALCAVLACDLDRFKAINDSMGHAAGDRVLRVVADRMSSAIRPLDTAARLGGDEFGFVLPNLENKEAAFAIAERLIAAVSCPIELQGTIVEVGLSVGLDFLKGGASDPEETFKRADLALYEAKASGRGVAFECTDESGASVSRQVLLGLDMKEAMRRGDFYLCYQPVVDVASGAITSFEALMRWRHPTRGEIPPSEFIPVAEDNGLIIPLGIWALQEACQEATKWPSSVRVAVNVSALQLRRDTFLTNVLSALAVSKLAPNRLKLEVTESVLMHDAEGVLNRLRQLQGCGVRIALDDFGTGFSSLSYLRRFSFDKIKIDRDFIHDIADEDTAAIVRAVVSIGERLGMGIVAEGVETAEQLELVKREGCTEVQGYFYARPMAAHEVKIYLANFARDAA